MLLEVLRWSTLGEDVNDLILIWYIRQLDLSVFKLLPNKVVLDVRMFEPLLIP